MIGVSILLPILIIVFFVVIKNATINLGYARIKWLIGAYGLILLAALLFTQFFPQEVFREANEVDDLAFAQAEEAESMFYEQIREGRLQEGAGVYVIEKWTFRYDGNELIVSESPGRPLYMLVVAERTDDLKDEIEVIHYATRTIVERFDLTDSLEPPGVKIEGNQLVFTQPPQVTVALATFQKEFVVSSLLGGGGNQEWMGPNRRPVGADALYLRVPGDLELSDRLMNDIILVEEN